MNISEVFLPYILNGEDKSSPFGNAIRNNYKHLRKWAKRTVTNAFRIYDREVPHFPLAIDFYDGRYCIQYYSPKREMLDPPEDLKKEVARVLLQLLGPKEAEIYWRTRAKNKHTRQYEKIREDKEFFVVLEYGVKFKVNLTDYLDTGLFLDHRETRRLVASLSKDKRVLNLFAYTCSFSIHAAIAGARSTKSVDMSNTYTAWGRDNFLLNDLPLDHHSIVRADCLKFLDQERLSSSQYDVIIIDPPTISRSTKMEQMFDIHEDYAPLIKKALRLLSKRGVIFFSTNSRKFQLDEVLFPDCDVREISHRTQSIDYSKGLAHRCWQILNCY